MLRVPLLRCLFIGKFFAGHHRLVPKKHGVVIGRPLAVSRTKYGYFTAPAVVFATYPSYATDESTTAVPGCILAIISRFFVFCFSHCFLSLVVKTPIFKLRSSIRESSRGFERTLPLFQKPPPGSAHLLPHPPSLSDAFTTPSFAFVRLSSLLRLLSSFLSRDLSSSLPAYLLLFRGAYRPLLFVGLPSFCFL